VEQQGEAGDEGDRPPRQLPPECRSSSDRSGSAPAGRATPAAGGGTGSPAATVPPSTRRVSGAVSAVVIRPADGS
jgi:hypothetical protein